MKQKHSASPKLIVAFAIISISLFLLFVIDYPISASKILHINIGIHWTLFSMAACFGLVASLISYYEYHGFGSQEGITRKFHSGPFVSITFDDGPSPKYTPTILDILKEHNVKATFFVVGKHVKKYPEIVKRMVAEGHDIGNHTYSHRDMVPAKIKTANKEIDKTTEILKEVVNIETDLFRPPRGIYSQQVRKLLVEKGFKIILWSLSTCDWRPNKPSAILKRVKRYAKDGSIILFHDSGAILRREGGARHNTVNALPLVIEYLKNREFKILPISEIISLTDKEPEIKPVEAS